MGLTPDRVWARLGWPDGPPPVRSVSLSPGQDQDGARHFDLSLEFESGRAAGHLLLPAGPGPFPAVLYCHAHGNAYAVGGAELLQGRPALQRPYGPDLAQMGIASLSFDLAPFGERQSSGPEAALAKALAWQGRPLMGQMLAELQAATRWLAARPEIDGTRIASLGLSMGATHAYWLAALTPELRATAHLCAFSDIAPLIASGAHDLHGPYMTVPGLLSEGDMGDVAALIAPRPQLICAGARDPLTPPDALTPALDRVRAAYGTSRALEVLVDPEAGHEETPVMRRAVLAFLARHLDLPAPQ